MIGIRPWRILLCGMLLSTLALAGCAGDWWRVDQSAYEPPPELAQEIGQNAGRAPVGVSSGGPPPASPGGEEQGEPSFQPHPAK